MLINLFYLYKINIHFIMKLLITFNVSESVECINVFGKYKFFSILVRLLTIFCVEQATIRKIFSLVFFEMDDEASKIDVDISAPHKGL